ncbi:MAG: polysaccharide deacetylase family protein [Firmicutes bacterium]|nr:polysaccharide deacetylase family protein [Bacillota bacterium]
MKTKYEKIFVGVFANLILIFIISSIFLLSFGGSILHVDEKSEYDAIYSGNAEKKQVSLMFNVYWGTEYIDGILRVLAENNTKATFFIGGTWAEKNDVLLKRIYDEGHEIGNHGFFHIDHKKVSYSKNQEEILITERFIEAIIEVKTNLFAPPSGLYSATTLKAAYDLGYKTIMWSKDTMDFKDADENLCFTRATKDLKNGDLILMHPTAHTLAALQRILKFYSENGFSQVPVSTNIA